MTADALLTRTANTVRESWQWSKSENMDGSMGERGYRIELLHAETADVDSYLRATVSYTDVEFDEPDEVSGVTSLTVRARPTANAAPTIPAQSIEVFENTDGTIGSVTASDDDVLLYSLWGPATPRSATDLTVTDANDDTDNDNGTSAVHDYG